MFAKTKLSPFTSKNISKPKSNLTFNLKIANLSGLKT